MNNNGGVNNSLEFRCSNSGKLITLEHCEECPYSQSCDIYATMLDEKSNY